MGSINSQSGKCKLLGGFTLVELLVTLGIIAILFAILLPAVFHARESARKVQCQNNLHQLIVAAQSHHSAKKSLPSFYNGTSLKYPLREWDLFHLHSWRVELLPYAKQQALKDQLVWDQLATADINQEVAQTPVSIFLCPSHGAASEMGSGLKHDLIAIPPDDRPSDAEYFVARSDYDAMAGIAKLPDPLPTGANVNSVDFVHWGIWGWPIFETRTTTGSELRSYRQGRFRDVTDGLSNTLAIVERGGKPKQYMHGKLHATPENPDAIYPGQVGWSASNTFAWSINSPDTGINESNANGIYSFHSGGSHVSLADGSVRFLSDTTDYQTLVKLYGRSDGGLPED